MPTRLFFASAKTIFFVVSLFILPSPAFAGFQWVAPTDPSLATPSAPAPAPMQGVQTWQPMPSVPVPALRSATSSPEVISPVVIGGSSNTMPSSTTAPVADSAGNSTHDLLPIIIDGDQPVVNTMPPVHPHIPASMAAMPSVPASDATHGSDVVHGFAKNVPVTVALRQILPVGYGFSVDPNVDMSTLVSFQGGRPWRDTLHDTLEPAGLVMHENGQMVSVSRGAGATVVADKAPVPAPMYMPDRAPHALEPSAGAMEASATPTMPMMNAGDTAPVVDTWHAERGDSLRKILEAWCRKANIELNWVAEYDYPLQASFSITGNFEDAVRNVLTGFENAHPQPIAELHVNPSLGQKTLIVQTRGNVYSD